MKNKILVISAKCSDLFCASLQDGKGNELGEYNGYVPDFFPGEHYGDYVQLEIDIVTGQILNWNKPTAADLKIFEKTA